MNFLTYEEYKIACYLWLSLAFIIFFILLFVKAPYGRHRRKGWGVEISARKGWMVMESIPAVLLTAFLFLGQNRDLVVIFFNTINCFLNGIWLFELSDGYEFSWFRDPR